jgi:glycosyltransferase involved in cell wall biosynthesis
VRQCLSRSHFALRTSYFKMMRVLMTTDAVGGVWTYALELARALAPHGIRVSLATMGPLPSAAQRQEAADVPGLELWESDFQLEWMDDPWRDVARAGRWLLNLEAQVRPQVVHLNGYAHAALPWRNPVLVVAHSCVCSWWQAVKGEPAPATWSRYRAEVQRGLLSADHVAAPTRAMLEALTAHYGPLRNASVLPNGRRPELFPPASKEPLVFTAGRLWDEAKNLGLLEAVAARLPWPVYVAGDERHPAGGSARIRRTRALGKLTEAEVGRWLGRAAIYALPARYEPFGLSALEAAFAGCALVLGDIPTLREVWGDAALFVPCAGAAALEAAIRRLIADPGLRAELGARARERALLFTPEPMAAAYREVYRALAGCGSPEGIQLEETRCGSHCSTTRSFRTGTTATPTSYAASSVSYSPAATR